MSFMTRWTTTQIYDTKILLDHSDSRMRTFAPG
jgi:hypothetical protein